MNNPNEIAPGNNPDRLTNAQVGEGYRLLTREEVDARDKTYCDRSLLIEKWFCGRWRDKGYFGNYTETTYRVPISAGSFMPKTAAPQIDWKARAEKAEQERDRLREALEERTDQYNQATEERDQLRAEVLRLRDSLSRVLVAIGWGELPADSSVEFFEHVPVEVGSRFANLRAQLADARAAIEQMPTCRCGMSTDDQCELAGKLTAAQEAVLFADEELARFETSGAEMFRQRYRATIDAARKEAKQ